MTGATLITDLANLRPQLRAAVLGMDFVIPLNERQLRGIVRVWVSYYDRATHTPALFRAFRI
jgi:hypothetical protein